MTDTHIDTYSRLYECIFDVLSIDTNVRISFRIKRYYFCVYVRAECVFVSSFYLARPIENNNSKIHTDKKKYINETVAPRTTTQNTHLNMIKSNRVHSVA